MTQNPYVGPRAFRSGEKLPARDLEKRYLTDLLIAERVVLLHSPSGAGKTSLIQAGVTPLLQAEILGGDHFLPTAPLRIKTPAPPDRAVHNRYIYSAALGLLPDRDPRELESLSFQRVLEIDEQLRRRGDIRVLIFDQFEEILTLNPADWDNQAVFFRELGTVLASKPVWALFSMREDYIGGLDRFLPYLPGQLEIRYRLDLLTADAARIAILEPAKDQGVSFADEAADELLKRLRTVKVQRPSNGMIEIEAPYVEPFQLQVVCWKLWGRLVKEKCDNFNLIEVEDIKHHADVRSALGDYYDDILGEISITTKAEESAIREWFETRLITEQHFRSQTQDRPILGEAQSADIIRALQDAYIIRSDSRTGSTWYELSHDQLIEPVLESNNMWRGAHLAPWQLAAREWQHTHRDNLLLSGAGLRSAERQARATQLSESEREFLNESLRIEQSGILAQALSALSQLRFIAIAELAVIISLLILLSI
jgi:hypothetical protein